VTAHPPCPVRVMIVEDSAVMRGLITHALEDVPEIQIVATAFDGAMAIENLKHTQADVILLDIEMPCMDGITALPQLLKISPQSRVIMVSDLMLPNATITLRALELGASDYIAKPSARNNQNETQQFYRDLIQKIKALTPHRHMDSVSAELLRYHALAYPTIPVKAIAIGSSTGGPQALGTIFEGLASQFPRQPVFITQHMPSGFTTILARHLSQLVQHPCVEGKDGEVVQDSSVYLAPGDYHMVPEKLGSKTIIRINQDPLVNFCRPAIDPMLHALLKIYGKHLLVVILTGMGCDGLAGSRAIAAQGGTIIAQDAGTSVVWGMPRAVTESKLCSAVLPVNEIAPYIIRACI